MGSRHAWGGHHSPHEEQSLAACTTWASAHAVKSALGSGTSLAPWASSASRGTCTGHRWGLAKVAIPHCGQAQSLLSEARHRAGGSYSSSPRARACSCLPRGLLARSHIWLLGSHSPGRSGGGGRAERGRGHPPVWERQGPDSPTPLLTKGTLRKTKQGTKMHSGSKWARAGK